MSGNEEKAEELLHSDSIKEKNMVTTFKNSGTQLRDNYSKFFEWKMMYKYRLRV
jgi:hypothetical protein